MQLGRCAVEAQQPVRVAAARVIVDLVLVDQVCAVALGSALAAAGNG